jgi:RND family efflux transporter MFP subunit
VRAERETRFDGVIEAVNQATVAAQTGGRVTELPYDVGDFVRQGEVIVRLTGTEQKAQAGAAAATLREAEARLTEAKVQYDRVADTYARGLVARAALDRARADLDSAAARVEAARNTLAQAREQADYTVVRAPYSGIVVKRHVEVGETVSPGRPLMSGLSLEHLRAVVEIPQQHIGPLRSHKKARVLLPDERSVAASELRIPPNADPETHTFRVLVTLPQGDYAAFPGTLVKVAFVSGEQDLLLVPSAAVLRRAEITAVYVAAGGRPSLRYVRAGTPLADGRVPLLSGLVPGEQIYPDAVAAALLTDRTADTEGRS